MESFPAGSVQQHLAAVTDPRMERTKRHSVLDIVTIAVGAVSCGADTWGAIEHVGQRKEALLRQLLELPHGIPSHDTFGRVVAALDPAAFERGFLAWVPDTVRLTGGQVVALDGNTLRRAHDRTNGKGALHRVSAWAAADPVVLGQVSVDETANEIPAIPAVRKVLAIAGCIVTIAAMGSQTAIARTIRERDADDVLARTDTHPTLAANVTGVFADALGANEGGDQLSTYQTVETNHGRLDKRRCWTQSDPTVIAWLNPHGAWVDVRTSALVESERRVGATTTIERRSSLSRLAGNAATLAGAVRGHWGIENRLHWVLDLAIRADECRVRSGHAAENLAVPRHVALNLLRREATVKVGIATTRRLAGWNDTELRQVLTG